MAQICMVRRSRKWNGMIMKLCTLIDINETKQYTKIQHHTMKSDVTMTSANFSLLSKMAFLVFNNFWTTNGMTMKLCFSIDLNKIYQKAKFHTHSMPNEVTMTSQKLKNQENGHFQSATKLSSYMIWPWNLKQGRLR